MEINLNFTTKNHDSYGDHHLFAISMEIYYELRDCRYYLQFMDTYDMAFATIMVKKIVQKY